MSNLVLKYWFWLDLQLFDTKTVNTENCSSKMTQEMLSDTKTPSYSKLWNEKLISVSHAAFAQEIRRLGVFRFDNVENNDFSQIHWIPIQKFGFYQNCNFLMQGPLLQRIRTRKQTKIQNRTKTRHVMTNSAMKNWSLIETVTFRQKIAELGIENDLINKL